MHRKTHHSIPLLVGVAICLLTALPVAASDVITLVPQPANERLVLTVNGPGDLIYEKAFAAGSQPVFKLFDESGKPYPDGSYLWELRSAPVRSTRVRGAEEPAIESKRTVGAVASGSFAIVGGEFASPDLREEVPDKGVLHDIPTKDVLHYDDVIITGSLCVGFDCANGESFGYSTVKLKENNLQFEFDDTSIGSFPTADWKIQINDTTSGGASYWTLWDLDGARRPFTIEAGAPAHSLYVEDYGRVGLGTSIPYVELHMVDGDSPTIRLDQDGSSGWTAQRWDLCGNETNFFIRDVTNGSKLTFRIQPNTPSNTLCLKSDGNVGIGTWSPQADLHVDPGSGEAANFRASGDSASFELQDYNGPVGEKVAQHYVNDGVWRVRGLNDTLTSETVVGISLDLGNGRVGINEASPGYELELGSGAYVDSLGRWQDASSRRYKDGITDLALTDAAEVLQDLNPVSYHRKGDPSVRVLGFIAEDVPDLVAGAGREGLAPMDFVAVLTKVVQQQQQTIAELQARVAELEGAGIPVE